MREYVFMVPASRTSEGKKEGESEIDFSRYQSKCWVFGLNRSSGLFRETDIGAPWESARLGERRLHAMFRPYVLKIYSEKTLSDAKTL